MPIHYIMRRVSRAPLPSRQAAEASSAVRWLLAIASLAVIVVGLLLPRAGRTPSGASGERGMPPSQGSASRPMQDLRLRGPRGTTFSAQLLSAEETVARKLGQFARSRLAITRAMAGKFAVGVPPEVDHFFAAVEAGRWEEVEKAFEELKSRRPASDALNQLWGPIVEAFGVAEVAHKWPAQKLLDYGDAVLGSLRPGMVYAGGTDPGRFIPTLLNETSGDAGNIVLTQHGLADNSYLKYLDFLYHDRLATLSDGDSQRAFSQYIADAQKRLAHDQQNPDEPKQVRPGEDIRVDDGRVTVSGQVAVMAVNERLLQMLMDKNPGASFALEESFPLKSMYSAAVPLGPIMELRAASAEDAYTPQRAEQAVDYWRSVSQQLLSDPEVASDSDVRKAYAKMAAAQAGLLEGHHLDEAAGQALQVANTLSPANPEVVFRCVNLLLSQNRSQDALQVAQTAASAAPDNPQFQALLDNLKRIHR